VCGVARAHRSGRRRLQSFAGSSVLADGDFAAPTLDDTLRPTPPRHLHATSRIGSLAVGECEGTPSDLSLIATIRRGIHAPIQAISTPIHAISAAMMVARDPARATAIVGDWGETARLAHTPSVLQHWRTRARLRVNGRPRRSLERAHQSASSFGWSSVPVRPFRSLRFSNRYSWPERRSRPHIQAVTM
jgi:hypothetical protein